MFPAANLAAKINYIGSVYYSVANGVQSHTGNNVEGATVYSDPEVFIRTPMTYNSTFDDQFAAQITTNNTVYRRGSVLGIVDGFGTLTTAAGDFYRCAAFEAHFDFYR